jgi:5-deoxy-glucuronate isomerase
VSSLLVRPAGEALSITPESAGWTYVAFEVVVLREGERLQRATGDRELCIVVVAGRCHMQSVHGEWRDLGGRPHPFSGPPDAAYLPPGSAFELEGARGTAEIALCSAPAAAGTRARVLPGAALTPETRGHGTQQRTVLPILMGERAADSLLVCEVLTPPGHWSSYPPHKHDRDRLPAESFLEETYYHRIDPAQGFALQRVYTADGSLDEALVVRDRDVVLVPRGYHTVSLPPGYAGYYLNVMAGPTRTWAIANDPDHEWTITP